MGDDIVWKEARSQGSSHDEESDRDESEDAISCDDDFSKPRSLDAVQGTGAPSDQEVEAPQEPPSLLTGNNEGAHVQSVKAFSHHQLNLNLRRNITKLADPAQHKPKPNYVSSGQTSQTFDKWLENALVAISPTADVILFAGSEKTVFMARLKMEPVNQYTTKALDIPLDYDEQVTSLICLPIMSTMKTSIGLVDWTALVVGLSSGYVKFYTEQSICLLSLKFSDEPVVSIKLQTQKVNTNARSQTHFASIVDELFITHRTCAIVIDGIGLYENLRISKEDVVKNRMTYEPAYNISNLPTILTCQKWKFEVSRGSKVVDADLLGMRCTTRFDALRSDSINYDHIPSKSFTRTIVLAGANPFLAYYREAKETVQHSYTQMIGSLLPFWSKPEPSRVQINEISCSSGLFMFDKGRRATSIVPSPDRRLVAITDDFGRVMLVDTTNWLVVRMWKGYRNAQCGWVEVKRDPEEPKTPYASFLVIYAPKRGLLEVWLAQRGPRVAAFNVGKSCRLLYAGHRMLNMRAEPATRPRGTNLLTEQSYNHNCYLLNAKSETLFAIELPYTYSLYKYGDLKSRDRLLINELSTAIQNEAETNSMSDIIQRMALAESLQISIQKVASNLLPDKIAPVMESLINKIMKDYDNHAGETMSPDDLSIVELCKRIIRLCSMFKELSKNSPSDMSLPEVNQRLIDEYEEHPKEVDEFAEQLGWDASEVLRYLSLMALERSFRKESEQNPWPSLGEPLSWSEFVGCFDLERINYRMNKRRQSTSSIERSTSEEVSIKLKDLSNKFLKEGRLIKTSVFMYNKLSERYYRLSANSPDDIVKELRDFNKLYTHLDPSSRLVLLFEFWLSTKLCNHWKMWAFLQKQVGIISDELRVIAMTMDNDDLLIDSWKRIYHLILESSNIYAAIIATAAIRSDTLRMRSDNEKREKLERKEREESANSEESNGDDQKTFAIDWECLCVDAERMSIFTQQLEDVFLLSLLLRYCPNEGKLVNKFTYRVPTTSLANIMRHGPTVISELVAQWIVQTDVGPKLFTQQYGSNADEHPDKLVIDSRDRPKLFSPRSPTTSDKDEHTKELLHHVKASFPHSLDADVLLLNCVWEFCNRWTSAQTAQEKGRLLERAYDSLSLLSDIGLKHNSASWAYKTFFQRTFERSTILIETNSTILSPKCLRSRDTLAQRELNMNESCLDDFVAFCFKLSEFMLDTYRKSSSEMESAPSASDDSDRLAKLRERLTATDEWWSAPSVVKILNNTYRRKFCEMGHDANGTSGAANNELADRNRNSLVSASLSSTKLFDVNSLIELNRLATLMVLIFKLKIIKTYPLSIIGEKSRQTLKLDLQQSPSSGADMKSRSGLLNEMRHKFSRKCIVSIVAKIGEESNELDDETDNGGILYDDSKSQPNLIKRSARFEDIDTGDDDDDDADGRQQLKSASINKAKVGRAKQESNKQTTSGTETATEATSFFGGHQSQSFAAVQTENSETMALFTHLLSLACEWQLDSDELHLELVFELYRCNHDKLAAFVANRTRDKQTLSSGLLKIASQRVLLLFGLSPMLSSVEQWRKRVDKWSLFQPNIASWLKSIQEEESRREIAQLGFAEIHLRQSKIAPSRCTRARDETREEEDLDPAATDDFEFYMELSLGVRLSVLSILASRTRLVLEMITNYLDGQANRIAYDLLQLLESDSLTEFMKAERDRWTERRGKSFAGNQSGEE